MERNCRTIKHSMIFVGLCFHVMLVIRIMLYVIREYFKVVYRSMIRFVFFFYSSVHGHDIYISYMNLSFPEWEIFDFCYFYWPFHFPWTGKPPTNHLYQLPSFIVPKRSTPMKFQINKEISQFMWNK